MFGFEYVFCEIGSVGCVFTFIGGGEDDWTCVDDKSEVIVYIVVATIGAVCVERDSFEVPILVRCDRKMSWRDVPRGSSFDIFYEIIFEVFCAETVCGEGMTTLQTTRRCFCNVHCSEPIQVDGSRFFTPRTCHFDILKFENGRGS
jgi:hypothetical protein